MCAVDPNLDLVRLTMKILLLNRHIPRPGS